MRENNLSTCLQAFNSLFPDNRSHMTAASGLSYIDYPPVMDSNLNYELIKLFLVLLEYLNTESGKAVLSHN